MGHQFLTKDWFGEVARIHEEIKPPTSREPPMRTSRGFGPSEL